MIRTLRAYFKQAVPGKDRFRTNDKPSQINFFKWLDSIAFIGEKDDTATTAQQGLGKAALDTEAAGFQLNNNADGMTRVVLPYQMPEVIAADASIVVTPVLYRQTAGNEGVNIQGETRRRYKVSASGSALNEAWKTIGGGGNFANGQAIPAFTTACTNTGAPIQVRKTATNKIAIRGFCTVDSGAWVSGAILFTLPVGYRPAKDVFLVLCGDANLNSAISIQTTGDVVVDGYVGADRLKIPEIEVSVD